MLLCSIPDVNMVFLGLSKYVIVLHCVLKLGWHIHTAGTWNTEVALPLLTFSHPPARPSTLRDQKRILVWSSRSPYTPNFFLSRVDGARRHIPDRPPPHLPSSSSSCSGIFYLVLLRPVAASLPQSPIVSFIGGCMELCSPQGLWKRFHTSVKLWVLSPEPT